MSKIININGKVDSKIDNPNLKKLLNIYDKCLLEGKEIVLEITNSKNYSFLLSNYIKINNEFINNNNEEKINDFSNLIINILNDFSDAPEKVWAILFSYNIYRIYNDKFLSLTSDDLSILISLYMVFEYENLIPMLDKISDFAFDKELMQELYSINLEKRNLVHFITNGVEEYLCEGVLIGKPVSCYIKEYLDIRRRELLKIKEDIKLDTIPNIYNYLNSQIVPIACMMADSEDDITSKRGYELISELEMFECKMKNMSEDNYNKCIKCINSIIFNKDKYLLEKIELIFNVVDVLSYYKKTPPKI